MDLLPDTIKSRLSSYSHRAMESHHQQKENQLRRHASPRLQQVMKRSPFQRFNSPSRGLSAILHFVGLCSFASSFRYLIDHPNPINISYGWHFQYLTIIGLLLATLTFILGGLADLTTSPTLFYIKNVLSMCSAPLECLISLLYWGLRSIDPKLVVPAGFDLPIVADLGFHAIPSCLLTLDLLFFSPPWHISVFPALGLSTCLAFAYWFWIELCYSHNHFYPYPLFDMLDTTQRVALFSLSACMMAASTSVLKSLYASVNGVDLDAETAVERQRQRQKHLGKKAL